MTSIISSTLPDRSRLVRLLAELSASKASLAEVNLAQHLGRLIGLSDSINLAYALGQLPDEPRSLVVDNAKSVQDDVLVSREQMIKVITHSFIAEQDGARVKVPSLWVHVSPEMLQTFGPFQRFYTLHQTEMIASVQSLRVRVRDGIAGFSSELHRLAELDRILDESLSVQTRTLFKATPKLLEPRFNQLLQEYRQAVGGDESDGLENWLSSGGWLDLLYRDIRELLLAELDVRLQPVLGLLEALNEHLDTIE